MTTHKTPEERARAVMNEPVYGPQTMHAAIAREIAAADEYLRDQMRGLDAIVVETRAELRKVEAERDNEERWANQYKAERDAARARVAEVEVALREIVTLTDRKHVAWDRARALLALAAKTEALPTITSDVPRSDGEPGVSFVVAAPGSRGAFPVTVADFNWSPTTEEPR